MKALLIIILTIVLIVTGCASWRHGPSVCDTAPSDSYLCALANKYDISLEWVGEGIVYINLANIGLFKFYTTREALNVMREIREALAHPITYAAFKAEVDKYLEKYPGMIQVKNDLLKEFDRLLIPIATWDRALLIGWIDEQIEALTISE